MEAGSNIIENSGREPLKISFWIRLLIGAVLLAVIVSIVNAKELIDTVRQAELLWIMVAAVLVAANIGLQILKWGYLLRFVEGVSGKETIASFFFGITLGSFTPGQLGEFGGRAVHLPSARRGTIIGLAVIDKMQVFGIMAVCGILGSLFLYHVESLPIIIVGVLTSLLLLVFLVRFSTVRSFLLAAGISKLKHRWVAQAVDSLLLFSHRDILITTIMTVIFYGVVYLQLYCLMNAFQEITMLNSFLAYSTMMISKTLLPFSIADLGIREIGLVYFASEVGYDAPAALASSLLLFVMNIAAPSLVGLFFIPHTISLPPKE